jgi:hypothetical protein
VIPKKSNHRPYVCSTPWKKLTPEALTIHCSDPNWQSHFREFRAQHLAVVDDPVVLPGGGQFFHAGETAAQLKQAGTTWSAFLTTNHKLKRIICIGHENCAWYRHVHPYNLDPVWQKERQLKDLQKLQSTITKLFPSLTIESYFGYLRNDRAIFAKIS